MKIKTLPTKFKRGGFDWELIERKDKYTSKPNSTEYDCKKFGLYKQNDKTLAPEHQDRHFVVCRIMDKEPHPDTPTEFDLVEKIPTDRMWGELANTYPSLEEAKKEYDLK